MGDTKKKNIFSKPSLQNLCGEHMQHESLITSGSVSHTVFLFRYHTGLNKKIEQRTSKPNFVIHWQTLLEKIPTGLDHNNFLKRCTLNRVPLCQHSIQFSILKKKCTFLLRKDESACRWNIQFVQFSVLFLIFTFGFFAS